MSEHIAFFFELDSGARGRLRKCPDSWDVSDAEMALEAHGLVWRDVWRLNSPGRRDSNLAQRQAQRDAIALVELWVPGEST